MGVDLAKLTDSQRAAFEALDPGERDLVNRARAERMMFRVPISAQMGRFLDSLREGAPVAETAAADEAE